MLANLKLRTRPVMLDRKFAYETVARLSEDERARLLAQLREELAGRLVGAADPAMTVAGCVQDLQRIGHELWSFDESDDFEIWCGDWTPNQHRRAAELMLEFRYPAGEKRSVDVHWKTWRSE